MALKDENSINFDMLEDELMKAVAADQKYQEENDAKFRAVAQKVGSYDEFRYIKNSPFTLYTSSILYNSNFFQFL